MKTRPREGRHPQRPHRRMACGVFAALGMSAILGATAYGEGWANLSAGQGEKGLRAVAVDPLNPQRIFIGSTKGVFTSGDGGKVWVNCLDLSAAKRTVPADLGPAERSVVEGLQAGGEAGEIGGVTAIAIDPANSQKIVAGSADGIYLSTDGGKNWSKADGALKDAPVTVLGLAVDLSNPDMVYAATLGRSLVKSGDGGKTWSPVDLGSGEKCATAVAVHPFDSNMIYVGTPDALLKTKNGGATWEKIAAPPKAVECISVDPVNPEVLYIGTASGLFKSSNAGAEWKEAGSDALGQKTVRKVAVSPSNSSAVYAVTPGGVYGSSDAGAKWQDLSKGTGLASASAIAFDPLDSGTIWVAASGGLYRTAVQKTGAAPATAPPAAEETVAREKPAEKPAEKKAEEVVPAQTAPAAEEQVETVAVEEPPGAPKGADAASGPAVPTIDDVQTVLGQFSHEPTVQEVQEVAMRFAEVHPDLIEGWRKGAKYRALLPKFKIVFEYDRRTKSGFKNQYEKEIERQNNEYNGLEDETEDSPNTGITISETLQSTTENKYKKTITTSVDLAEDRERNRNIAFTFEWELGDFLFNPDQVRISDEARDLVELRNDVLEEVTQFYFQRRQLQIDLLLSPAEELRERLRLELQLQEVTANIDYLTGGYLTQRLNDVKQGKERKSSVVKRMFSI